MKVKRSVALDHINTVARYAKRAESELSTYALEETRYKTNGIINKEHKKTAP